MKGCVHMTKETTLQPTFYLDCDHPVLQKAVHQLTDGCKTPNEVIQRIFLFIRDDILTTCTLFPVISNTIRRRKSWKWETASAYRRLSFSLPWDERLEFHRDSYWLPSAITSLQRML